jgi:myo-inositol-1-phosphate synthase
LKSSTRPLGRLGVWVIGARGAIAAATMTSVALARTGRAGTVGLLTESPPYDRLPLVGLDQLTFGGCDVVDTPLADVVQQLITDRVLPADAASVAVHAGAEVETDIERITDMLSIERVDDYHKLDPVEVIAAVRAAIARFRTRHRLDRVVVLNVSSTEPVHEDIEDLGRVVAWDDFEAALHRRPRNTPWGVLYASAALLEGCGFVNFTPNVGAELPALAALARRRNVPCAGKDGKTGETLLKSVLAPMFEERKLRVLSWESYNLLGNGDGRSLREPAVARAKIQSKNRQLAAILKSSPDLHTHVSIDYVPSLGDWKTAWNFVHFEGFLGTRMTLQFVWQGCDTMLATPLVLDLIRFVDLALRRGEGGDLPYLAAYFKSPHEAHEHDFRRQCDAMLAHFAELLEEGR